MSAGPLSGHHASPAKIATLYAYEPEITSTASATAAWLNRFSNMCLLQLVVRALCLNRGTHGGDPLARSTARKARFFLVLSGVFRVTPCFY